MDGAMIPLKASITGRYRLQSALYDDSLGRGLRAALRVALHQENAGPRAVMPSALISEIRVHEVSGSLGDPVDLRL